MREVREGVGRWWERVGERRKGCLERMMVRRKSHVEAAKIGFFFSFPFFPLDLFVPSSFLLPLDTLGSFRLTWNVGLGTWNTVIAVGLGHVKPLPHVPMISDLCVSFPEAYVFRAVFVMVASAMMVASVTFHDYIQLQLDLAGIPGDRAVHMTNRAACGVSALSCVFLIVLTVCSENEDDRVHSVSAVIFFVLYLVYMGLVTTFLSAVVDAHKTSVALVTKTSLRIKQVIALANFASLAGLGTLASMGWGKHANMIAVCEWAAVLLILAFNASFIHEFSGSYVAVIQDLPSVPDPASENDVPRSAYSRVSLIDVHHDDA